MKNRLQFRHHSQIFDTREAAIRYIESEIQNAEDGLAVENKRLGFSLFGEPTVLRYKNEEDPTNPHILFVIGSVTNEGDQYGDNRFCIIDIDKTEKEIESIEEALEEAILSLTVITKNTDTLNLYVNKADENTVLSGDVKVAESNIFSDNVRRYNNLMVNEDGLFIYVNLSYNEETETFTFTVNNNDGTLSETSVKLPNNYLVSGSYSISDESLHLVMRNGEEVVIDCSNLISEWTVEGEASKTPVVLTKDRETYTNNGEETWKDVLHGDIRIKDETFDENGAPIYDSSTTNILRRTSDGRYLYVRGEADNIKYGEASNVKEAIDQLMEIKLSQDSNNILTEIGDGFFANVELEYVSSDNKLIFKKTSKNGEKTSVLPLNSVEILENIYYEDSTETLIITYKDNKGETKFVRIPIGELLTDWEWEVDNNGHNVELTKTRNVSENDKLSADLKILEGYNNILVDNNHYLYVRGEADNIKYGNSSNVKEALDTLKTNDISLDGKIEAEISRAETKENEISNIIGSGFSPSNTVRSEIDALNADTSASIKDVINNDHSINVDKSNATKPVLKVNISEEVEDSKPNIIKLNTDGLYAGVDLEYQFDDHVGTNRLIFKTTNDVKTIDLKTNSVVDKIYYDPVREALVIEYTINGVRQPDVVVPLGDLINEWTVWEGHEGAIQLEKERVASGTSEQDILKASVVISNTHNDNIIINDNGALYVSGQDIANNKADIVNLKERVSVTETNIGNLNNSLSGETLRASNAETTLDGKINQEIENRIASVNAEETRAKGIENELRTDLSSEVSRSTSKDQDLTDAINNEKTRALSAETALQTVISTEVSRSSAADAALSDRIDAQTLTFNDSQSIDFDRNSTNVTANVKISHDSNNIITIDGEGILSSVDLNYDGATNKLTLLRNGMTSKEIQLSAGSLLNNISYDQENKNIVVTYTTAQGVEETMSFPAAQLFNEWEVDNVGSNSAIKLYKIPNTTETGTVDLLRARVKILGEIEDAQGNITYDYGDNALRMVGDYLYVSTSSISEDLNCVTQELKTVENAVFGEEARNCGNDFTYTPPIDSKYIISANTIADAVSILDNEIYQNNDKVNTISGTVGTLNSSVSTISGTVGTLSGSVNTLSGTVGTLSDTVDNHSSGINAISGSVNTISGTVGTLNSSVNTISGSVNTLSGTVSTLNSSVTTLSGSVNTLSGTVGTLNGTVDGHSSSINAISGSVNTLSGTVGTLNSSVSTISDTVDGHSSSINAISGSVNTLSGTVSTLNSSVTTLSGSVNTLSGTVNTLSGTVDSYSSSINTISGSVNTLSGTVNGYSSSINTISGSVTTLSGAVNTINETLSGISENLSGETPSAYLIIDDSDDKLKCHVRLSHGNETSPNSGMTDAELVITDLSGETIESGVTYFSDTNVIRIVNKTNSNPSDKFNGIYLSNYWNCGKYYQQTSESNEISIMEGNGYIVDSYTDETQGASNYNYMNNVRQNDLN